jgi:hypothetical protein
VTRRLPVRMRRCVDRREVGPATTEAELLRMVADAVDAGALSVQSIVVDWRDDGCYAELFSEGYVVVRLAQ